MKEIFIRTKLIPCVSSEMIDQFETKSLKSLVEKYGNDHVLETIFQETNSFQQLKKHLLNENGLSTQYFQKVFLANGTYGVSVDAHIYLYRFDRDQIAQQLEMWNWCYAEAKMYIGDVWWFDAAEIFYDVQNLPIIDFFEKYKGF